MTFRTKNCINFLLGFIGFSTCFGFFFMNIWAGLAIGFFLSLLMFFDPKKYEAAKKKTELDSKKID